MKIRDEEKLPFKKEIVQACRALLMQRIATIRAAIQQAQESANSEEKSSAGDKHETSRAMSQLETEMNGKQLAQAERDLSSLDKLNITVTYSKVSPGSVIIAGDHILFIGAGLGNINAGNKPVIALSPHAPLALQLLNRKDGDKFMFKGSTVTISMIF